MRGCMEAVRGGLVFVFVFVVVCVSVCVCVCADQGSGGGGSECLSVCVCVFVCWLDVAEARHALRNADCAGCSSTTVSGPWSMAPYRGGTGSTTIQLRGEAKFSLRRKVRQGV